VRVETVLLALTRAPVPADGSGRPPSACQFVLAGLPNHAGPAGVTRPGGMA